MFTHDWHGFSRGRRAFLQQGTLILATAMAKQTTCEAADGDEFSVGLITDLHYADKPPVGTRHYRETLEKLAEATEKIVTAQPRFVVELGDFVDAADAVDVELSYLKRIQRMFTAVGKNRHYVLGNHCVDTLTKDEFLGEVEREKSYYSFDEGGFHFVVLDSCFRSDGVPYGRKNASWTDPNVPPEELEWLRADLAAARSPVIVFAHQRLDVAGKYSVKNAAEVRAVLEKSDVRVVLQGHSHANDYQQISGIHYCTLVAMIEGSGPENNGYSLLRLSADGTIRIEGFRQQASREMKD